MAEDRFQVEVSLDGPLATLTLTGELDMSAVPVLQLALDGLDEGVTRLVVDLSRLEFLDSSGISELVRAQRGLPVGGELQLSSPRPNVLRILEITGLDHLVVEDPDSLLAT